MPRYYYEVDVTNTFNDTISVCVEAEHAGAARKLIAESLPKFPDKIPHDKIVHCFVENREKVNTDIITIKKRLNDMERT